MSAGMVPLIRDHVDIVGVGGMIRAVVVELIPLGNEAIAPYMAEST